MLATPNTTTISVLTAIALIGSATAYFVFKKRRIYKPSAAKVCKLIVYPVKSLQGVEVKEMRITKSGAETGNFRDRALILLNDKNAMITQRQKPELSLVKPTISGPNELTFEAPGQNSQKVTLKTTFSKGDKLVDFKVWGSATQGVDCGDEVGSWFSEYLGQPEVRLIQHLPQLKMRPCTVTDRKLVKVTQNPRIKIQYQDGCPLLLISNNSIVDINSKIPTEQKGTDERNWRPNIVIEGSKAFEEEQWHYVKINDIHFDHVKPCTRCSMPTINPDNGVKDPELTPLFIKYLSAKDEKQKSMYGNEPLFGINLAPESSGTIAVGHSLETIDFED